MFHFSYLSCLILEYIHLFSCWEQNQNYTYLAILRFSLYMFSLKMCTMMKPSVYLYQMLGQLSILLDMQHVPLWCHGVVYRMILETILFSVTKISKWLMKTRFFLIVHDNTVMIVHIFCGVFKIYHKKSKPLVLWSQTTGLDRVMTLEDVYHSIIDSYVG